MKWIIIIYVFMSLFVMDIAEPHKCKNHPIVMTIVCFIAGGGIFIFTIIQGIFNIIVKRKRGN